MTMPKFEPVGIAMVNHRDVHWVQWKADVDQGTNLHTADQLTEAYEAGEREAIPEGWVLVPKEPDTNMLVVGQDAGSIENSKRIVRIYKAMLASAPKGEK